MAREVIAGSLDERSAQLPSERVMQKLTEVLGNRIQFDRSDVRLAEVIHRSFGMGRLDALGVPPIHVVVIRPGNNDVPVHCAESGYSERDERDSLFAFGIGYPKKDKDVLSFSNMNLIPVKIYDLEFEVTRNPNENKFDATLSGSGRNSLYFTSKEANQAVFSWPIERSKEPKPQVVVIAINPDNVEDEFIGRGLTYRGAFVASFEDTEGDIEQAFHENGLLKSTQDESIERAADATIRRLQAEREAERKQKMLEEEKITRLIKEDPRKYYDELNTWLNENGVAPATPYNASYSYVNDAGEQVTKGGIGVSRSRERVFTFIFSNLNLPNLIQNTKDNHPITSEDIDLSFEPKDTRHRMVIRVSQDGATVALESRKSGEVVYSQDNLQMDPAIAAHFIPKLKEFTPARPQRSGSTPSRRTVDSSHVVFQSRGNGSLADAEETEKRKKEAKKLDFQNAVKAAERSLDSAKEIGWRSEINDAQKRLESANQALEEFNHPKQESSSNVSASQPVNRRGTKHPYSKRAGLSGESKVQNPGSTDLFDF